MALDASPGRKGVGFSRVCHCPPHVGSWILCFDIRFTHETPYKSFRVKTCNTPWSCKFLAVSPSMIICSGMSELFFIERDLTLSLVQLYTRSPNQIMSNEWWWEGQTLNLETLYLASLHEANGQTTVTRYWWRFRDKQIILNLCPPDNLHWNRYFGRRREPYFLIECLVPGKKKSSQPTTILRFSL